MKKIVATALVAAAFSATSAYAADLKGAKQAIVVAPAPSPWDFAFGGALMSDYIFRGITQSAHKPSVAAYFEPRYNINKDFQLYAGVSGESIDFPNRAAAEIDFYGGFRPTFGKLALDFGAWYYWYPGGQCFNTPALCNSLGSGGNFVALTLPNGNVVKKDLSFVEVYGKATYTFTDEFSAGVSVNWSPSVLNSGADGTFVNGTAKYVFPSAWFWKDWGLYASADVGHWFLGTSDAFYAVVGFPGGIPYKSYTTWDLGFGVTWKKFTLDFRYYDTDLNKGDCNAFTSDHTATGVFNTAINPGLPGSNWCSARFVVKGSFDLAVSDLK